MPAGAGLGFRRELIPELEAGVASAINFFEIAPENWIDMGGLHGRRLRPFTERFPFVCHGLSLSLGGPAPLDEVLLHKIKALPPRRSAMWPAAYAAPRTYWSGASRSRMLRSMSWRPLPR